MKNNYHRWSSSSSSACVRTCTCRRPAAAALCWWLVILYSSNSVVHVAAWSPSPTLSYRRYRHYRHRNTVSFELLGASPSSPFFYNDFEDFEAAKKNDETGGEILRRNNNDHANSEPNNSSRSKKRKKIKHAKEENDDDNNEEDEDDNGYLNVNRLGNWRELRHKLAAAAASSTSTTTSTLLPSTSNSSDPVSVSPSSISSSSSSSSPSCLRTENEALLKTQCEELAREYTHGVWAHAIPAPEVGGLVVRMPLESELYHNTQHLLLSQILHARHHFTGDESPIQWFPRSHALIERRIVAIAEQAAAASSSASSSVSSSSSSTSSSPSCDQIIDASTLDAESAELLRLYLDHQETWQEVCLVLEREELSLPTSTSSTQTMKRKKSIATPTTSSATTITTTTLVLNRPMALKLTESLARMLLYGFLSSEDPTHPSSSRLHRPQPISQLPLRHSHFHDPHSPSYPSLRQFMQAFGNECAVYMGGPDDIDQPAEILHGIANLPGAEEISPGTRIYCGGLNAAIQGVLQGLYKPMDFRFFVGRHSYSIHNRYNDDDRDDVLWYRDALGWAVRRHQYQPIACARSLVLKQCISLPQPLWHEVLELCGGTLADISVLERTKQRDQIQLQVVEEEEADDEDDEDDENTILDELSELYQFDDSEEDMDSDDEGETLFSS